MGKNLTNKTVSSANWSIGKTLGQNIIAFIVSIVLARLIAPEEFGLLAIAMIFVGLGKIFSNLGINTALIQKKNLNSKNLRAALALSLLSGFVIYSCVWIIAPFAAVFFDNARAEPVIRWIGLIFLINAFTVVGQGVLMRHFKYKPIFIIELISKSLGYGVTGIILAILDYGVWSLVFGVLVHYTLMAILYLFYVKIPFVPVLKGGEYKRLFRFGGGVSLLGFFNYVAMNIDNLIIGRLLNATQLGFYSKAFSLMSLPIRNLSYAVGGVSMSTFSAIQDDKEQLKKAYYKAVNLIFMVACPIAVVMIFSSEYLILGLYGPQWEGAVAVFRILSFGIVFKVFFGLSGSLAKSTDRVFKETIRQLVFAAGICIISLSLISYGIEGVAAAVSISSFLFFILMTQLSLDICGGKWSELLNQLKDGSILGLLAGLINGFIIVVIEIFLWDYSQPLKLTITLFVLLISGLFIFFRLPNSIIGPNRDWLIKTYSAMLPGKLQRYINKIRS